MTKVINFNEHQHGWCALMIDIAEIRTQILAIDDDTGELIMVRRYGDPKEMFSKYVDASGLYDTNMIIQDANGPDWEQLHLDAFISDKTKNLLLGDNNA